MDGDSDGFGASDEDDKPLSSCDCGVKQISAQQFEVLGVQRDDDAGSFAALIFMDGDGPCKGELIHLLAVVDDMPIVELHADRPSLRVNGPNKTDIPVEDLFLVIILHLDDLVVEDKGPEFCAALMKELLEACVQLGDPALSSPHRGEDLDLLLGVKRKLLGDPAGHEVENRRADLRGLFGRKEKEVAPLVFEKGHLSVVDAVGVLDDLRVLCLAVDLGEADCWDRLAFNKVLQYCAGADAGKLIDIADDEEAGMAWDGFEEREGEGSVDHACLIDDQQVAKDRVFRIMFEEPRAGVELQKPMDGLAVVMSHLLEALGGSACRGGQDDLVCEYRMDGDDGSRDGAFARSWSAGEDGDLVGQRSGDSVSLFLSKGHVKGFLGPSDGF